MESLNLFAFCGVLIMRGFGKLPLPLLQKIGGALGTLGWYIAPYRKSVGMVNLKACFPDWSEEKRNSVLKQHYKSIGIGCFELAAAWYGKTEDLNKHVEIEGFEHIEAVRKSGKGALFLTGHFTGMELTGRVLLERFRFSCLYRAFNQPVFAKEMDRIRKAKMNHQIHFDQINDMIKYLRQGEVIWYTPDQGKEIKQSELVPFFAEPAITNAVSGRLAKMGKGIVVPFFGYRQADGSYKVKIFPPVDEFLDATPERAAKLLNEIIESFIEYAPEQYFWLHRRFKRRGHGLPNLYKNA